MQSAEPLTPGRVLRPIPGVRQLVAPNPSALTGPGTNTYLLGEGEVTLIDPGPDDPAHLAAVLSCLAPAERIVSILVTHAHLDHSALAPALARATGAPVAAFGTARDGAPPPREGMARLGGGEGVDNGFVPDIRLAHGQKLQGQGWTLEVLHTPGHLGNHICLAMGDSVFSGDQAMGWATSIVSPPDGDMAAYMRSLELLSARRPRRLLPGHGAMVADAMPRLAELSAHRREREAQILQALSQGPADIETITGRVYTDVMPALLPAASRNVLAHLIDLIDRNLVLNHARSGASDLWHLN